ncbi:MAG: polysaccharide deacetylase family protein [Desulfuromonadales bacterium]|nr:MAG: polysaccharide deacetylase family protein [Desulfuromonadales bacterium]
MIRVPILMYHAVDDDPAAACVRPSRFEEQMAYLSKAGYVSVDLDAVHDYLSQGATLPQKPIVITFDDGYRDNVEIAYPILKKYGMCATIYLATGHLGYSNRWNAGDGVAQRPLLTWEEVCSAAGNPILSFQAHTCSHPKLTRIPPDQVREELGRSKQMIEERLGRECHHFAYPYGDYDDTVRDAAEEAGFLTACTTRWGHNRPGDDLFSLYRIGVRNGDSLRDFKRILGEPPPLWKYYWLRLRAKVAGKPDGDGKSAW